METSMISKKVNHDSKQVFNYTTAKLKMELGKVS